MLRDSEVFAGTLRLSLFDNSVEREKKNRVYNLIGDGVFETKRELVRFGGAHQNMCQGSQEGEERKREAGRWEGSLAQAFSQSSDNIPLS